ncbi:MAG: HAD family hydrolase [Clostridia bacterium]|nr:HAD family hydrolase [Clostridia bacterium]
MRETTYLQLKKNLKKDASGFPITRFALLGDCATQHLACAIRGYAYELGENFEMFEADYDQIDAQLMDSESEFFGFRPDTVLIQMCTEKLYERFVRTQLSDRSTFAEREILAIRNCFERVNAGIKCDILFFLFLPLDDGVFGAYTYREKSSFAYQLMKLNMLLADASGEYGNVRLIDLEPIRAKLGADQFKDAKMYAIAKMPMSTSALVWAASRVVDAVRARKGRFHKCAVVDLDNTLWGGVIGDDGLEGIEIGELGQGHAFTDFQIWLKELKNRGIMLAVCSKNNEATAREPFEKHPEMVLRLDDFSAFAANWEDKASNILKIRDELNIGLDSIVFFDDNPFERNLVKTMLPEVEVVSLPEDPANYVDYVRMLNLFDTASYSEEDQVRTERYLAEKNRSRLNESIDNYDDYLKALEMKAVCAPFDAFHTPRIAQLTQRSNQFNVRTVRYTDAEIAEISQSDKYITRYFTLKDKFGDHGLIAVVILERRGEELFVAEWLMSCRVLKRGMEQFISDAIMKIARQEGFLRVIGEYIETPKNAMVKNLYTDMGFESIGDNRFLAVCETYKLHNTYIREESI